MNDPKPFTVLRGGLAESHTGTAGVFQSAYVTDTRLMGVIGLAIHWTIPEDPCYSDLHQLFYFDAEETGFDTYWGALVPFFDSENAQILLEEEESALLGGLGGQKVPVTEREARFLVQTYVAMNRRLGLPLPEGYEEYEFLLTPAIQLSEEEEALLMVKQCPALTSPYQVINYFLMRCFAKDFSAAKFLTKHYVRTDLFGDHKAATLLRNAIDPAPDPDSGVNTDYYATSDETLSTFQTRTAYLCESLIEYDEHYYIVITQVTLEHLQVVRFERLSSFRVSTAEAAMMLARPEYVTVFDLRDGAPMFSHTDTPLARRSMVTPYDNGTLFMIFYPHNDHVDRPVFLLNDDVMGLYYLTDFGQLILSAFSEEAIRALEADLAHSPYIRHTVLVSKYQFQDPVLYEFISGDFEDFEDFVAMIMDEDPPE